MDTGFRRYDGAREGMPPFSSFPVPRCNRGMMDCETISAPPVRLLRGGTYPELVQGLFAITIKRPWAQLDDEHGVAKGVETVAVGDGLLVGPEHQAQP